MAKYLKQSVDRLDISEISINILKEKKIDTLGKLSNYSKNKLNSFDLLPNEINKIEIELELLGITLRNN